MGSSRRARRARRRRRRVLVTLSGVAAMVLAAGVAVALWPASGTGSGTTKALSAQGLTVNATASPVADLFPGATGALQFTITNPNPYPVSLTSIAYGTVSSSDPTGCPAANLVPGASGVLGTPISVPANATSGVVSIPAAVTLSVNALNGCQGVTFTVGVTLSGSQA
jgi:hypothetical protein